MVLCDLAMQVCSLCGLAGATVACYHPDCGEMYHMVCALFSNGYVNFGQKDPYLPCPACPRHTLVKIRKRPRTPPNRDSLSNSTPFCNGTDDTEVLYIDQSC
uniref:Transcription factor 20 n=1 Tax=Lygus hesperus TaxID=30085 RepID=A0A0A9XZ74_LYGHE